MMMAFEAVLMSTPTGGSGDKGTNVSVKMKNLLNDNIWLWDRGKFTNRRFLMQVFQILIVPCMFVTVEDCS